MENKVLVAYASKYGATKEIAEKIGEVLQEAGCSVDVQSVSDVKDLSGYQSVVLGSAAYIGGWRKEAVQFLKAKQEALKEKQVWIFSSGPTGEGDPVELLEGWKYPKKLEPIIESIAPKGIAVFHGAVFTESLTPIHGWMIRNVNSPVGDFRDWEMIADWAGQVAEAVG